MTTSLIILVFSFSVVSSIKIDNVIEYDESANQFLRGKRFNHGFVEEILSDLTKHDNSWSINSLRYFNPVGAHPTYLIGEDPISAKSKLSPFILKRIHSPISALIAILFNLGISVRITSLYKKPSINLYPQSI